MKLHFEPIITLVARPQLAQCEWYNWTSDTGHAGDSIPEIAGRLCYMSYNAPRPGGNAAYLDNIKASGHGSVLEHVNWSFIIEGISRTCSHEMVRHRAGWAYSQLSQRYVDESVAEYVVPPELVLHVRAAQRYLELCKESKTACKLTIHNRLSQEMEVTNDQVSTGLEWLGRIGSAHEAYVCLVNRLSDEIGSQHRKRIRQSARSLLPNATETKIFATANARALRHFVELRGSKHADLEIQNVARKLLLILQYEAPNLFGDYSIEEQGIVTPYRKV